MAKLDRMKEFADARICRRKILLNYFGETIEEDCGNCDVCQNPPEYFKGTLIAQKALSAVARLKQQVPVSTLVDVLKGSKKPHVVNNNYHKIRTFGIGKDLSATDWYQYIMQLINLGLLEVAYDEGNALKLTDTSDKVLYRNQAVYMVNLATLQGQTRQAEGETKTKTQAFNDRLFEHLGQLRKRIADHEQVPPYVVFNDATLQEMVMKRPTTEKAIQEISGVSTKKLDQYGQTFMDAIISFIKDEAEEGNRVKGSTYLITYDYYQKGYSIEAIAQARQLNTVTIYSHLASLFEQGYTIPLLSFLETGDYEKIKQAIAETGETQKLKPVYDYLEQSLPYYKIRLALTYYRNIGINEG